MKMNSAVQQLSRFYARRKETLAPCPHSINQLGLGAEMTEEGRMNANGIVFYVTLTNCVITDNPSLARSGISVVPACG